ncbi:MAG: hypothetical protein AAF485_03250 [Chloroflexota bacterium]
MSGQTYLPLKEAAEKHSIEEKVLTQLISAGMIEVKEEQGEVLVVMDKNGNGDNGKEPTTKDEIIAAKFAHLRGQKTSAYSAQKKYDIHRNNFAKWARSGYITILDKESRPIQMDSADVAYCAYTYKQKKQEYGGNLAGATIFDEDGNPYQVKYPDLAAKRRETMSS